MILGVNLGTAEAAQQLVCNILLALSDILPMCEGVCNGI